MEIRADQLDMMHVNATGFPIFVDGKIKTTSNTIWDILIDQDVIVTGFNHAAPHIQEVLLEIKEHKTFHKRPINWKTFVIKS